MGDTTAAAAQGAAPVLPFSFSGVLYLNYQYGGVTGKRSDNKFDLARSYLTFRAAAGDRDSVRVTIDTYQQTDGSKDAYYRGWAMRVKYGYLQHDLLRGTSSSLRAFARLGILQTVMIEKEEQYWNRGLSSVAEELEGYFNSADAGAAVGLTLPNSAGEVYVGVMNGSGYTSRETDRFKDFQARLTLVPWARGGVLKGLQVSPWVSLGGRSSDYASGKGTVAPVADALDKHRYGLLLTYKDARFTAGASLSQRLEEAESADTTVDVSPDRRSVTGSLGSFFAFVRPAMFAGATRSPWQLLARVDQYDPDVDVPGTKRRYIVGSMWELNSRTSVTFDVQSVTFRGGQSGANSRTYFLHVISSF